MALGGASFALAGLGALLPLGALAGRRGLLSADSAAHVPVVEIALLRRLPLFAPLPAPALERLARRLEPVDLAPGEVMMRQGEPGERFYLVAAGELEVRRDGQRVGTLARGEGCGEIALLRDVPRRATVSALGACQLYALEKAPFLEALTGHPAASREAELLVQARTSSGTMSSSATTGSPTTLR